MKKEEALEIISMVADGLDPYGEDTIENSVALCPNCHRKMHVLNFKADVNKLQSMAAISAL